jgi:hypothetical protein
MMMMMIAKHWSRLVTVTASMPRQHLVTAGDGNARAREILPLLTKPHAFWTEETWLSHG